MEEQAKQIDTSAFPQDIAGAHAVIVDLQTQIEQMRQQLARLNKEAGL